MLNWKGLFRSHILDRGWEYANNGSVRDILKTDDIISAVVQGSEYYRVEIRYSGTEVNDGYCSCPYAAKGEWCKHMAAVLYLADSEIIAEETPDHSAQNVDEQSNKEIIDDVKMIKKEIDRVFNAYSDRSGYIDYYNAMGFESDLENLLENRVGELIDNKSYMDAFNISMYAYIKLGNWDIDDDGQITAISSTCYEMWRVIIDSCDQKDRERIKKWFEEHSDDGTVIDYMEDTLRDFLQYELVSEDELREIIKGLEEKVESSKGQTKCPSIFTAYYGYSIEAIELRNIFARRLGATNEEIEDYMRRYMSFRSVREYFMEKARGRGDTKEEIKLLTLGKEFEKDSSYTMHSYSSRLIELYALNNDKEAEKLERKTDVLANQSASLRDYREYRAMCTNEEWQQERLIIIGSREDIDKKCEFLADEKMQEKLFETIWEQKDKLSLVNKYGFALMDDYSEQILDFYSEFVSKLADVACNRSRYDELNRYLMRMSQFYGGKERVRQLAFEWIEMYPTRKVMVEMLQRYAYC